MSWQLYHGNWLNSLGQILTTSSFWGSPECQESTGSLGLWDSLRCSGLPKAQPKRIPSRSYLLVSSIWQLLCQTWCNSWRCWSLWRILLLVSFSFRPSGRTSTRIAGLFRRNFWTQLVASSIRLLSIGLYRHSRRWDSETSLLSHRLKEFLQSLGWSLELLSTHMRLAHWRMW